MVGRGTGIQVLGPVGTTAYVEAIMQAFKIDIEGRKATVERRGDEILLRLVPEEGGDARPNRKNREAYFFSTDDQINSDKPQRVSRLDGDGLELALISSFYGPEDPETFEGVLYSESGWLEGGRAEAMRLRVPWPDAAAK